MIENYRNGIMVSKYVPSKFNPLQWSSIEHIIREIRPPFPLEKNPDNFYITFKLNSISARNPYIKTIIVIND